MTTINLGEGFFLKFFTWKPDRKLNPQYDDLPDLDPAGAILTCRHGIEGVIHFDMPPEYDRLGFQPRWQVVSQDPLTLSPSIDTGCCHGFIREGKWTDA